MSDSRPGMLSSSEVQQLQLSLQSRSIREVALTVCTIRGLAVEVKSILRDLFHDEIAPMISSSRSKEAAFSVMPMAPPDPFQRISAMNNDSSLIHPNPTIQKTSAFARLLMKRGRRRHRCSHCPRTFTAQSSVWRHMKTHHTALTATGSGSMPGGASANDSPSKNMSDLESSLCIDLSSNHPDTSVPTPRQTSVTSDENVSVVSPLPSTLSQNASSPEDHMSPMPTVADMFTADSIKPEPSDTYKQTAVTEMDSDMEIISPSHPSYNDAENPPSLSSLFSSPAGLPRSNEDQIRAAVDAQLMEPPVDGMYHCSDCGWRSKSVASMRSHILSHKGILPFSCNVCNYKTNKKHVLTRHYTIHTGEKPHKCPICTFGSLDHVELLKHMTKTHPGVHPFTCTICGFHATTNTLLKKHMKSDHSMTPPRQSPSSSRALPSDMALPDVASSKNVKPRNVLSSSSETIFATSSINQPVFP
ncbi:zinc finger protein Gfi-1b-like [Watersipora subatra]|uniref:zinc finger protein Gfi-1b-like n=1 Tax=Watersipora subatra TaxID=2589382 RepID=UPI00355BA402